MKAYLINLDRSIDRLKHMEQQFAKVGLPFERVPAVDGKLLNAEERADIKTNIGWTQPLTASELGCFLSHRKCFERIAQGEDLYAVIFEDDVKFSKYAPQFFAGDDWIPMGAEVIKLETHGRKILMDAPVINVAGVYDIARLRSQNILSAGYIISRDCARKLLDRMNDAAAPMDHFLFTPACGFFKELVIYQVSPVICEQAGLTSTLGVERTNNRQRPPVWFRVIREIKRPFQRLSVLLWGMYINRFTTQSWGKVAPFLD